MTPLLAWVLWSQVGWIWYVGAPPYEPIHERPASVAFVSATDCERAARRARRLSTDRNLFYVCLSSDVVPTLTPGGSR